jgi:DtxR family Mn-dependent transcriptional regulator
MEDYLEAIYNIKVRNQVARVKDISREMNVRMPSVTGALKALADKGLVIYQPYESVELTQAGLDHARGIAHRHTAVREFLTSVLGLPEEDVEQEACGLEHAISPETLDRLLKLVDFIGAHGDDKAFRLSDFQSFLKDGSDPDGDMSADVCYLPATIKSTRLSELCPGMKGRIAFVSGRKPIRKRLVEMGMTSDTHFEVLRTAPFGDPIEIKIRGYNLSLRRSEAEHVEVEVIND